MRRDHRRGHRVRANTSGWRSAAPSSFSGRVKDVPGGGEDREQERDRVGAGPVGDVLDVGVGVGIEARGDRDRLGEVVAVVLGGDGGDRLAVGADDVADAVREPRQRAAEAAALEQLVGAERAGGDDDAARRQHLAVLAEPRAGVLARDRVAVRAVGRAERADLGDGALGEHLDAVALGEPEVVLDQRVLGVVAAADHAGAAADAARARRPVAAEVGVGDGLARLAEEDPDAGGRVGLGDAHLGRELAQQRVGGPFALVGRHAEHALGGVVVRARARPPSPRARPTAGRGRRPTRRAGGRACWRSRGCRRRRRSRRPRRRP